MKLTIYHDGNTYHENDFNGKWDIEFTREEAARFAGLQHVDSSLCGMVSIGKLTDGRFLMWWEERHPEMVTFDEHFYPDDEARHLNDLAKLPSFAERTSARADEWDELRRQLPSKYYAEEITRREAFEVVIGCIVPEEFHADAGL